MLSQSRGSFEIVRLSSTKCIRTCLSKDFFSKELLLPEPLFTLRKAFDLVIWLYYLRRYSFHLIQELHWGSNHLRLSCMIQLLHTFLSPNCWYIQANELFATMETLAFFAEWPSLLRPSSLRLPTDLSEDWKRAEELSSPFTWVSSRLPGLLGSPPGLHLRPRWGIVEREPRPRSF